MTKAAVAEHVYNNRLMESLTEFGCNFRSEYDSFRIVTIHVENRSFNHFRYIRRIWRRTGEGRIGGETDLVIDDEVNCTGNAVTAQTRQTKTFRNNALTGKCRITMQQQRHDFGAFCQRYDFITGTTSQQILLGAGFTHNNRIDDFEMRRVCCQ